MRQPFKSVVFSLLLIATSSNAQDILWEKSYGGKHAEYLFDAQPTADYGFILAGSSISGKTGNKEDANKGDLDYWIWKMDEKGDLDWQKSFGGSGVDLLQSIRLTSDGGYILAGISDSKKGLDKQDDAKGNDDFWIIKLDAKGNQLWQKTIGGSGQEKLHSITLTADGGYLLGGSSASYKSVNNSGVEDLFGKSENTRGNLDYWIVKLKKDGSIEWQKTLGGKYADEVKSVAVLSNGNYLIGGTSNSPISGDKTQDNLGLNDFWILQLDKTGNVVWQQTIGGEQDDNLFALTATNDGGFIVGGNSNSPTSNSKTKGSENGSDFWVIKFDKEATILWQEVYNYGERDVLTSIIENEDGTYLIGGYAQSEASTNSSSLTKTKKGDKDGINDYIALKISSKGEEIWTQTVGSKGEEVMKKLLETRDGGYLLAGTSNPQSENESSNSKSGMITNEMLQLQNSVNNLNSINNEVNNEVNKTIKDNATNATNKINDAIGGNEPDSRFKFGLNSPTGNIDLPSMGSGTNGGNLNNKNEIKLPASRDKKNNLGHSDFWVVKLKDKTKPEKEKLPIEAFPNPAVTFTNIIIGFDYTKGTANIYDLSGRPLQSYTLDGNRTLPIEMSGYPTGIYIVEIVTDKEKNSIKIIKK